MAENTKKPRMGILEEMTMDEVQDFRPEVVVVPVGSTEPHGPHLPYCSDTIEARCFAEDATMIANSRGARVLCYPVLPISLDVNFSGYEFALSLRVKTFMRVLRDICEQIERQGVRKIVIANLHGGNYSVVEAFLREWSHRGIAGTPGAEERAFVCAAYWPFPKAAELIEYESDHGGENEVLAVMAERPELLRKDKLAEFKSQQHIVKALDNPNVRWVKPWHLYLPEGACGETRKVMPEKAEKFVKLNAEGLAELLVELSETPWSEYFPYEKKD
ncbi:MAG: creatininase family protein [Planctomycetota bacterium]|jgi:creatinine amidohydrolase